MTPSTTRTKTPPALKWLLNERAALEGALLRTQTSVGTLQKRVQELQAALGRHEESALACQAAIAALDVSIGLLHPEMGNFRPAPVNGWQGKYGVRGGLQAFLLERAREAAPAPVTSSKAAEHLAAQLGLDIRSSALRQRLLHSVREAFRQLAKQGLVERVPALQRSTEPGRWRLKESSPLDQLLALARAQESGHDPPVDATGGQVDCQ